MHCDLNEITQITVWTEVKQENTASNTNGASAQNINKYYLIPSYLWIKPILIQIQQKLIEPVYMPHKKKEQRNV